MFFSNLSGCSRTSIDECQLDELEDYEMYEEEPDLDKIDTDKKYVHIFVKDEDNIGYGVIVLF